MVDAELGTKRTCPSCASRFYDLNKHPISCPSCEETFVVEPILPSKGDAPPPPKPAVAEKEVEKEDEGIELISLEEVEKDDADDDEAAAIKDVDLGEDVEIDDDADDDAFLEDDDDDDAPVTGLIGGAKAKDDD